MIHALVYSYFDWLPLGLWIPAAAVLGTAMLVVVIKLLGTIFSFLFKFIDIFI